MRFFEIGTGYTSIPADKGAATEIVVENLSRSLIGLGHDVTVFDIADSQRLPTDLPIHEVRIPGPLSFTDESLGIKHKMKRVLYSLALCRSLSVALRQVPEGERVVIHFHNQYNAYFFLLLVGSSLRQRAFVAYTNHSYIWHDEWESIRETVKRKYFQEVRAMRRSDLCFVLNRQTLETFSGPLGMSGDRLVLIPNGVNTHIYHPLPTDEVSALKDDLGLSGRQVILQVGSVCDRKNQLGAVELLAPFLRERPALTFVFVGGIIDESYLSSISSFARENGIEGQVVYSGELAPGEKLNHYYNIADAMLFPAKAEGFSLVVLEAMAAGLPVLLPDSLNVDLPGCITFSNTEEFRKHFLEDILTENRRSQLSKMARSTVESAYSWDSVAQSYVSAIRSHMSNKEERARA